MLCNLPWVSADCSRTVPSFSYLRGVVRCVCALVSKTQDLAVTGCALLPILVFKAVGEVVPVGRINVLMVGSCLRQSLSVTALARAADPGATANKNQGVCCRCSHALPQRLAEKNIRVYLRAGVTTPTYASS